MPSVGLTDVGFPARLVAWTTGVILKTVAWTAPDIGASRRNVGLRSALARKLFGAAPRAEVPPIGDDLSRIAQQMGI